MRRNEEVRLYVLVSNKLEPVYGAVQGGHAIAQWMLEHSDNPDWRNNTVVYLSCDINRMFYLLEGEDFSFFKEPDIGNVITSIAIVGNEHNKKLFKKLKLLK